MKKLLLVCVALGAILVALLTMAGNNASLFARHYTLVLALNGVVLLVLAVVLAVLLWRLWRQRRARVFGSKLALRLVMMFTLVALGPGTILYVVSVQFLTRSIESWFNVEVENALSRGLKLGQTAISHLQNELYLKAQAMAGQLADASVQYGAPSFADLAAQSNVSEVELLGWDGQLRQMGGSGLTLRPNLPPAYVLKQVRDSGAYRSLETVEGRGLTMRVIVPVYVQGIHARPVFLQMLQPVPAQLAEDAELVAKVKGEYEQLSLSRHGLKLFYQLALSISLAMTLLGALALAVIWSNRLSAPLSVLAAGTKAVGQGDFSQRQPVYGRDELGVLTHWFNRMTRQLGEARKALEQKQDELEAAKLYVETILANLSSGVLVYAENGHMLLANHSAAQLLGETPERLHAANVHDSASLAGHLRELAALLLVHEQEVEWQTQLSFTWAGQSRLLLLHGARLAQADAAHFVVVLEDITSLAQAERDAAWSEVAKRLAHEIRNPLTPIQLSAERLAFKLGDKLEPADAEVLHRGITTIVKQVDAMKTMVDAFKEYARTPKISVEPIDLNDIVREVLGLYESAPIHLHLSDLPVMIAADATLMRQLVHNLLKNAQEALHNVAQPRIDIHTACAGRRATFSVADNGPGFPEAMLARVFEPYVTTKPKGTGLGLAIIKKIVEEHHGTISVKNQSPQGAWIGIELPSQGDASG